MSKPLHEQPIRNLKDLLASNIPIKGEPGARVLFTDKDPLHTAILNRFIEPTNTTRSTTLFESVHEALQENFATIVDQGVFITQPYYEKIFQKFDFYDFIMCFYMPQGHLFYEYFDKTMRRIIECGFLDFAISKMKCYYLLHGKHSMKENQMWFKISFNQLNCFFYLLCLYHFLCTLVFIGELAYYHFSKTKCSKSYRTTKINYKR